MKTGGIIVEGAEQQGKSTFCKALADRIGLEIIHYGPASKDYDYFSGYFVDIDERGGPFIFDRSFVSELAYGKIFNRKNITPDILQRIEAKFAKLGYFVVLLELNNPWIDREETVTFEQNEQVKGSYRYVYDNVLGLDRFLLKPGPEALDTVVAEYLRRQ